ncbi:MAG TPA: molybdopterin molybdenumtransferase MoeA [Lentisphaerae bacterium]|nr:molybdopterin molybdenumtransferase MoeA [Lentisphaerota bacterium]
MFSSGMTEYRFISVAEAERLIRENIPLLPAEEVALDDAKGRVLREDVHTARPVPPFNRVMMDGVAVASRAVLAGRRRFRIAGRVLPGQAPRTGGVNTETDCMEVMTGASLPTGFDAIIPYEDVEISGGTALLRVPRVHAGMFVHRKGSDAAAGTLVLEKGAVLDAARIAAVAGCGKARLKVSRCPSVALISNGDEVVMPGEPITENQIYGINNISVRTLLELHGIRPVSTFHCSDDPERLEQVIGRALSENDIVIVSGGVSMGKKDFVPAVLARLEVRCVFHKVRQRPGKPLYFGIRGDTRTVFALPGNPVSAMVCTRRYVLPALFHAMGARFQEDLWAELGRDLDFAPELAFFPPVVGETDAAARIRATPLDYHNSGHFLALVKSSGFVEIPCSMETRYPAGIKVRYFPWQMMVGPFEEVS